MGGYIGSYEIDDLCTFYANTHTPGTGAAVDADAVPGYRVYEDETGTPILTGTMTLLDDANTVGFYSEQLTLSAANGFEAGKSYCIRKTLVVGGVTGIDLDKLQMGAKVDMRRLGGSVQSAADLKDFADDGYDPATNKVQGVLLADALTTYTGNTLQTGDSYARIGAAGVSLSAIPDLAGVATLLARLTAARAGYLDNINNVGLATTVAQTGDSYPKVDTEIAALIATLAGLSLLDAAGVRTAVGLATANLDTQLDAISTKTTNLPSDPADASDVAAAVAAVSAALAALNNLSSVQAQTAAAAALTAYGAATGAEASAAGTLTSGERLAIADAVRMRQLSESYAADGVVPTLEQLLFMVLQSLTEFGIVGTALTTRRLDKSTTAMVHTLDDADAPTSRTRAT